MTDQIIINKIPVDFLDLTAIMERFSEFIENDHLNTIALITRSMILEAAENDHWRDYLRRVDLGIIEEKEILDAAQIAEGQVYEEVVEHQALNRIFWQIVKESFSVFLLCESDHAFRALRAYLEESYPGIRIVNEKSAAAHAGLDADHTLNAINSVFPDVIISGLTGHEQGLFLLQHQNKVFGKLWIHLGHSPHLLSAAGMKPGWLESRKIARAFQRLFVENT